MSHYKSNVRDVEFNLFELFGRQNVLGTGPFGEVDTDTAKSIIAEVERLAREELAESFADADRNPPVATRPGWTPNGGACSCPKSWAASWPRPR